MFDDRLSQSMDCLAGSYHLLLSSRVALRFMSASLWDGSQRTAAASGRESKVAPLPEYMPFKNSPTINWQHYVFFYFRRKSKPLLINKQSRPVAPSNRVNIVDV